MLLWSALVGVGATAGAGVGVGVEVGVETGTGVASEVEDGVLSAGAGVGTEMEAVGVATVLLESRTLLHAALSVSVATDPPELSGVDWFGKVRFHEKCNVTEFGAWDWSLD